MEVTRRGLVTQAFGIVAASALGGKSLMALDMAKANVRASQWQEYQTGMYLLLEDVSNGGITLSIYLPDNELTFMSDQRFNSILSDVYTLLGVPHENNEVPWTSNYLWIITRDLFQIPKTHGPTPWGQVGKSLTEEEFEHAKELGALGLFALSGRQGSKQMEAHQRIHTAQPSDPVQNGAV